MHTDKAWFDQMEARIPKGKVRTRFAPSPTGYMHVGNLRTALYTYLIARSLGGTFILRIEDTDQGRLVEGAVDVIYKTLENCGITHDEGPDVGGPVGPYIQTERRDLYGKYAELLIERGGAYRCFCGKDEDEAQEVAEGTTIKKHHCGCSSMTEEEIAEKLATGAPYVVRQRIPEAGTTTFSDMIFGDITVPNDSLDENVLIKSDGLPTYNFANVIDDHLMGITHVVRGTNICPLPRNTTCSTRHSAGTSPTTSTAPPSCVTLTTRCQSERATLHTRISSRWAICPTPS